MNHTKEPWERMYLVNVGCGQLQWWLSDNEGERPALLSGVKGQFDGPAFDVEGRSRRKRIVTCVNALAGLNPEAVRELIDAAESMVHSANLGYRVNIEDAGDRLKAALANLKEETA